MTTQVPDPDLREAPVAAEGEISSIGTKAGRGLKWSLFGTLLTKMGTFAIGLVLARLLTPADFGVYAVAMAATAFVMHVNDVGIIAATVQWRGKLEEMAPTATAMAIGFSIAVYSILWVLAPVYAELAGSPEATPLVRLLTAVILIDGVTAVRSAALMRRFQHDRLIKANVAGLAVNAPIAILLAGNGSGAYSFVVGQLAGAFVTGVLVFFAAELPFRVGFDRPVAARLLKFGLPLALGLGVESVLMNADYIVVGGALGPAAVGFYLLAFNVSSWVPGLVGTAVRYVSIPSYSRLAEEESDALSVGVQRSLPMLVTFVLPIAVVMVVLAEPLIEFLYGARWLPSAEVLIFLSALMIVRMVTWLAVDIVISLGKTRPTVTLNTIWAAALVPALIVGVELDGIRGAAIAHATVAVVVALPAGVLMLRLAGISLRPIVPLLVRPAAAVVPTALVMLALSTGFQAPALLRLTLAGTVGVAVYVAIVMPRHHFTRVRGGLGQVLDWARRWARAR